MLVPAPPPTYTLAPGLRPLTGSEHEALTSCLGALTGRMAGVLVVSVTTTTSHHMIEMVTPVGTMLALERVPEPVSAAA